MLHRCLLLQSTLQHKKKLDPDEKVQLFPCVLQNAVRFSSATANELFKFKKKKRSPKHTHTHTQCLSRKTALLLL